MSEIYLSKGGKTTGPFTEAEITKLKASGEIYDYTYIWDIPTQAWKAIEPPPPPPGAPAAGKPGRAAPVPPPDAHKAHPQQQAPEPRYEAPRPAPKEIKIPPVEAVCYDKLSALSGRLDRVTETGCEFVSDVKGGDPAFATRSSVVLNLLNPKTGKAMNVRARLDGVTRRQGQWALSLRWERCPEILL